MGLRGVQPYIPLRVMRQLGRRQVLPPNEDMQEFIPRDKVEDGAKEGSVKGPIDRETEVEVRIKQARLEVEENYRSAMKVLTNDLKNAKEELAQRDAIFEARVRKHRSTILTLQEDLGIMTGAMEQQEEKFKNEKVQLLYAQSRFQNQVKVSMERERELARRFNAYQIECEIERS
ncbi:hypothetical protein KY289_036228 [Solanum tuberosum]|nr:hypothetical protein KY284_037386 [Solanum tuberosum]KAH0636313.1 hypothetical protein KY289_036228 [Solanum tuberosum]